MTQDETRRLKKACDEVLSHQSRLGQILLDKKLAIDQITAQADAQWNPAIAAATTATQRKADVIDELVAKYGEGHVFNYDTAEITPNE